MLLIDAWTGEVVFLRLALVYETKGSRWIGEALHLHSVTTTLGSQSWMTLVLT